MTDPIITPEDLDEDMRLATESAAVVLEATGRLMSVRDAGRKLLNDRNKLRDELRAAQERIKALEESKTTMVDWEKKLTEKNAALSKRNARIMELEKERDEAQERINEYRTENARLDADREMGLDLIESLRHEIAGLNDIYRKECAAHTKTLEREISLHKEIAELKAHLSATEGGK